MDGGDILVPIAFFAMIAAIVLMPGWLKSREKQRLHDTLRLAYEKGQPLPPEMIEALQMDRAKPQPERDLRRGIVLLCLALAIVVFGLMLAQVPETDGHATWPMMGIAAFPGFIGIGYIAFWLASRCKTA
ncbi:MAG TPA: DUF6249 domain-containing protein [Caulobacteraceae bacterium]|nr:DUF6249 domain-containing protein [Caulobacteraceae bacterium]